MASAPLRGSVLSRWYVYVMHWDQAATNPDPHPNLNQNSFRKHDTNTEDDNGKQSWWLVVGRVLSGLVLVGELFCREASWGWSFLCCALICSPLTQMFHLPWSNTWSRLLSCVAWFQAGGIASATSEAEASWLPSSGGLQYRSSTSQVCEFLEEDGNFRQILTHCCEFSCSVNLMEQN